MIRCAVSFEHVLFGQYAEGGMQALEVFEVLVDFLGDNIDNVFRYIRGCHEGCLDAVCLHISFVFRRRIETGRNDRLGVEGELLDQIVDVGDRDDLDLPLACSSLLDGAVGVTDGVEICVDTAVLEELGRFDGFDLLSLNIRLPVEACV